jgi:hypothetical protein
MESETGFLFPDMEKPQPIIQPTRRQIEAGPWTRSQLAQWGVPWPPPKGWKTRLERAADALAAGEAGPVAATGADSDFRTMFPQFYRERASGTRRG